MSTFSSMSLRNTLPVLLMLALAACAPPQRSQSVPPPDKVVRTDAELSPANWPAEILEAYSRASEAGPEGLELQTSGTQGLVAATSAPMAVHAGIEALKQGGSAADAAIAVSLAQVALHLGGATSYAGQLTGMYFDASTGQVHRINAGYATVLGEDDPMSIPPYGVPSGRAVLVPGFMAGIESIHERFGRLAFAELFEPAIFIAEQGIEVGPTLAARLRQRAHVITRRPEGRALFLKETGELPAAGDRIRQPEVAAFLRKLASRGADYMYHGEWAKKLVAAVREEGGKMSLEDLARYQPAWESVEPLSYGDRQVYATGVLAEQLRLVQLAGLSERGHYTDSAAALYWLMKIARVPDVIGPHMAGTGVSLEEANELAPGLELSNENRFSPQATARIWEVMQTPRWARLESRAEQEQIKAAASIAKLIKDFSIREPQKGREPEKAGEPERAREPGKADESENAREPEKAGGEDSGSRPDHTAGIVAIDADGNMMAVVHSVTSAVWGELGIFVEGVSVVDPGAFAQHQIAAAGPGKPLSASGGQRACPVIVVEDGRPVIGCGNVGASFDVFALQGLTNMLEYGMTARQAARQPMFRKNWPPGQPVRLPVGEGEFSAELLAQVEAMGIDIVPVEDAAEASQGGIWVVGAMNPETGRLGGAVTTGSRSGIDLSETGLIEAY